jgi:glycosyltransferase involved in cell wall biosynthesis
MKVLAIMPSWPYPLSDGVALRAFHFLHAVAKVHSVHLVYEGAERHDPEVAEALVDATAAPDDADGNAKPGTLRRVAKMFVPGHVWRRRKAVEAAVRESIDSFRPDVLWVTHLQMSQYTPGRMRRRTLVDVIDDQVLQRISQRAPGLWPVAPVRKLKRLIDVGIQEAKCGLRCEVACFASRQDAKAFSVWCPWLRCVAIPNGVDAEAYVPTGMPEEEKPYVVFVGNYIYPPNLECAELLSGTIWPRVRQLMPELRCVLVGPNLPPDVAAAARVAGIEITGWVKDTRPFVASAAVVISPLISGHGIKNKVLEAWAMGKAVVALPAGVAGLEAEAREVAIVAQNVEEFARELVIAVKDRPRREALGAKARQLIEGSYQWTARGAEFVRLLASLGGTA